MASSSGAGGAGRLLRVDLTSGELGDHIYDAVLQRTWVGGSGIGARLLYDEVSPGVGWNDPENRLVVASGPLGGTRVNGSGTFSVITKGPLTDGAATTQANGYLGAFFRSSGYDGLILQGAADHLVYLYVYDGGAELRDGRHLAGKDTWQTQAILAAELGVAERALSVFSIGPAGENLVRFAGIAGDRGHVAGHNGVGAVMGSKRLKAIAVARGRRRVPVADSELVAKLAAQVTERVKSHPQAGNLFHWGTSRAIGSLPKMGLLPVKNYTTNIFPEHELFVGDLIRSKFEIKRHPCWACQSHHCNIMKVTEGPATGYVGEEPEYEQWAAWGPVIGNTDPGMALRLSNETDRLGFENNEAGWVVGWVMECYDKGYLTRGQLDGLDLRWGNALAVSELLAKIARREGIGGLLAEGVMRASRQVGGEAAKCAVYSGKGNSPRGHDHRALWHELLDTCTSSTGTIESGQLAFPGDFGLTDQSDPFDPVSVATRLAKSKGRMLFEDCLGVCRFCLWVEMDVLVAVVNAATGWDLTRQEAHQIGIRIANLLRVFNIRHGVTGDKDIPSDRYGSIPVDGPAQGRDPGAVFETMRSRYYDLMGWDTAEGRPLRGTLRALGLEREAAAIW